MFYYILSTSVIFYPLRFLSLFARIRIHVHKKIKNRIKSHDRILLIVRSCHRKDELPSGKERRMPARQARAKLHVTPVRPLGPHYGRYLVVGDITANCHPQKRNGPGSGSCWSHGVGRLLGASPTSRNIGFTTGAPSSPLRPAPSQGAARLLSPSIFHSHHPPVRGV